MSTWRLVYYRDAAGRYPVKEYIADVDSDERAKVRFDLRLLEAYGLDLGAPHVKSIGGKLWELRTTGRMQHRVLYFAFAGKRLVLLHAFVKKTQKTPPREIATARRRMADYVQRAAERSKEKGEDHERQDGRSPAGSRRRRHSPFR